MSIKDKSKANASFWDELCGSQLAKVLGIKDSSKASLKKFDDWYFDYYPYLNEHIKFNNLKNKDVLEIGLGYGTVSQKIDFSGAIYNGLDIALGPVNMVNHRIKQNKLMGKAIQGSILEPEFKDESFDVIVAIGCLHHTGNLKQAIQNCFRLLRPGGSLIFMVYYAYSYRRWTQSFWTTLKYFISECKGKLGVVGSSTKNNRAGYDTNEAGEAAPHTDWISKKSMAVLCKNFSEVSYKVENMGNQIGPIIMSRERLINSSIPQKLGLDLYVKATK